MELVSEKLSEDSSALYRDRKSFLKITPQDKFRTGRGVLQID